MPVPAYIAAALVILLNQGVGRATGFGVYPFDLVDAYLIGLVVVLRLAGGRYRLLGAVAVPVETVALLVYAGNACFCLSYAVQAFGNPYQDAAFQAFDRALGFDYPRFMLWVTGYPRVYAGLGHVYQLFFPASLAFIAAGLVVRRDRQIAGRFYTAFLFAVMITGILSGLFPARGGVVLLDAETASRVTGASPLDHLEALRGGQMREMPAKAGGLISFPSMHVGLGLLILWYARGTCLLPVFALPAVLFIVTALTHGAHYLADALAAVAVVAAACFLGESLFRMTAPRRRPSPDPGPARDRTGAATGAAPDPGSGRAPGSAHA